MLQSIQSFSFNPLCTGGLFHYYMLDESIRHSRGAESILSLFILFLMDYVASDLGLHYLPMTLLHVSK